LKVTNVSKLKSREEVLARDLKDPAFRAEWERTQFAHKVATQVIRYRVDHKVSQTELARRLGMRQPHIARLEAGQHEPSLTMLRRLSEVLGIEFHIDITPNRVALTA
jgi:ribosome-binding protein aMBF1 (putative translation factor)